MKKTTKLRKIANVYELIGGKKESEFKKLFIIYKNCLQSGYNYISSEFGDYYEYVLSPEEMLSELDSVENTEYSNEVAFQKIKKYINKLDDICEKRKIAMLLLEI